MYFHEEIKRVNVGGGKKKLLDDPACQKDLNITQVQTLFPSRLHSFNPRHTRHFT